MSAQLCTENLVPNPSFEDTLPHYQQPVYYENLSNWLTPNICTPDLYHFCNNWDWVLGVGACHPFVSDIYSGVPRNLVGYQSPKDGNAYIGILLYYDKDYGNIAYYKEYIQTKLLTPLKPCADYEISFYVSLGDTSNYASKNIQVAIIKDQINLNTTELLDNVMSVYKGPSYPIVDTLNWTFISHVFTAEGDEEWLMIGDFESRYDTNLVQVRSNGVDISYYYIDMVELCEVPKPPQSIPNIITPNGDGINDGFYVTGMFPNTSFVVYNRWGAEVFKAADYQNNWQGETQTMGMASTLNDGVYYYVLESPCGGRHTGTVTIAR